MATDPYITLRAVIANGTTLKAITGIKVYALEIPETSDWKNDVPALLIQAAGGSCDHNVGDSMLSFYLRCYGGNDNPASAMAVYQALRADTQNAAAYQMSGTGGIVTSIDVELPSATREPETGWPVVIASGYATVVST